MMAVSTSRMPLQHIERTSSLSLIEYKRKTSLSKIPILVKGKGEKLLERSPRLVASPGKST